MPVAARARAEGLEAPPSALNLDVKPYVTSHLTTDKTASPVLTNDPGIGVARHVDAGYEEAEAFAEKREIKIPMESS